MVLLFPIMILSWSYFVLMSWTWGMSTLNSMEGIIFSLLAGILFAISWVDFTISDSTYFYYCRLRCGYIWVITGEINYKTAIYGVIVGSVIPLVLIWFIS